MQNNLYMFIFLDYFILSKWSLTLVPSHFIIKPTTVINCRKLALRVHCYSNGGPSRGVTLQDIVRSDPGYTPNIEHLVFPERKSSNPNLAVVADGSPPAKPKSTSSGRSRLAEVFARHYARGSSQDSSVASRKNHVNVRVWDLFIYLNREQWGKIFWEEIKKYIYLFLYIWNK